MGVMQDIDQVTKDRAADLMLRHRKRNDDVAAIERHHQELAVASKRSRGWRKHLRRRVKVSSSE